MIINKYLTPYNHTVSTTDRIKYIVIHYVGATGGALANCKYYAGGNRSASAHYYVDFDGSIWQSVENKNIAWHCGAKSYVHSECRNTNSIGIEMCVRNKGSQADISRDWYFEDATVQATIALTRELMVKHNVPANHVIRHHDVTGKICPNPYVYNHTKHTWSAFKSALVAEPIKKSGWLLEDEHWRFYLGDTGNCVKNNWYRWTSKTDGNDYWSFFLGDNGFAVQGDWYKHNESWYYFDSNCAMLANQWFEYEGKWYYFCNSGEMVTNAYVKSKSKNDVYYFINKDGIWEGKEEINPNTSHFKVF
ncbi:N-acetylmuramoyl-L-alanine amidase [Lacrimispora sphenoides]|uniref:peptidoglycan recognition protein family protein n=1 Tax=Lacrimispora sphenoides TaxID=29370 RepID=UPI0008D76DBF|nr:peptidoglycan recognition family protein [Lacrimispora sphenoides]SEU08337.1 N-acetylmuramoyl-L-alanine amidase [Lacrimispora sphenoides]